MGNISRGRAETQVALEVARLATLSVKHLKARWRSLYDTEPPRYVSRELLTRAVGYRLQERAFGGLKPSTLRLLERLGGDYSANHLVHSAARKATDGTVLVREWRGVSHRVEVLDNRVVYQGQRHQSLSEVARLITGSRWSGPLFFGLKNRAKEARNGEVKRCAVYTRKSSEEGLEQGFNSLQAQREACEAFIKSQAGEGWRLIRTPYDDGGFSGGTMERPALQQLLEDIRQKRVDVIVVYKVDRLTRSLADFAKMVEAFDQHGVSFVAVTQQFNTTTSMGRLTLNVLLSFAQFEREVTGERIRDKIAASKKRGLWMGGTVPLGYDVVDRRLVINPPEAETVRGIYKRYLELGSITLLKQDLERRGIVSKRRLSKAGQHSGGSAFSRGALYELLANPIYVGEIRHRKDCHPGQHQAIVDRKLWDQVQQRLSQKAAHSRGQTTHAMANLLAGKLFDEAGQPLYVSGTTKGSRHYRYYVSRSLVEGMRGEPQDDWRLSAPQIEHAVSAAAAQILKDEATIGTLLLEQVGFSAQRLAQALKAIDAFRAGLDAENANATAIAALIARVELGINELQLTLNLAPLLRDQLGVEWQASLTIKRCVPMQLRRRGVELRIIMPGTSAATSKIDATLVRAIARGRRWFDQLATNRAKDTFEIAQREGVPDSYVRRLIPLAFLAPSVVEAICSGRQPPDLTAECLTRRTRLPVCWTQQEETLGLSLAKS